MSTVKVNTLTGTSTAGSITVTGEGNSTTTNLQQGLAKAWINFNGTGTIASRDSFNVGSLTDNGTGDYTLNFSNNMNNANYFGNTGAAAGASASTFSSPYTGASFSSSAPTTSAFRYANFHYNSATYKDVDYTSASIKGDLA